MRYRAKLFISLVGLTMLSCGLLLWLVYGGASDMLFRHVQGRVLAIASTGALSFPIEAHERVRTSADEQSADYKLVEQRLRSIRDANASSNIKVRFVYTMRPSTSKPGHWEYVVDGEEEGKDKSHVGDAVSFHGRDGTELALGGPKVNDDYTTDSFGTWLWATVPLHDASGKAVALMGVDVSADSVRAEMRRLLHLTLIAVVIVSVASLLAAMKLALWASSPLTLVKATLDEIGRGNLDARVSLESKDEFGEVGHAVNRMALSLQDRHVVKDALARHVSPEVAEQVLSRGNLTELAGSRKRITVLYCDIRNFMAFSSALTPAQVVGCLNEFFTEMVAVVFRHRGTLDKMSDDGLTTFFGAPLEDSEHALHAVEAAMEMQSRMGVLREKWKPLDSSRLALGIGLHTGETIVGNIGSQDRMEYTAIGSLVGIPLQLEAATKKQGYPIVMSRETAAEIPAHIPLLQLTEITVPGVSEPMRIFTLR